MGIDRTTWNAIREHFDALCTLDAHARRERLDRLDLTVDQAAALDALLRAHDDDRSDPLADSIGDLLDIEPASAPTVDWTGRRLGPWRVERRLAEGGMSVVYVGERCDGRFDMRVAIKVLKRRLAGLDPERLQEETRILARLQHPGIARLIDSGEADDSAPWLAMELVDGIPIDRYGADHALDLRARVRLLSEVADALDYAHQRQVVHCDIKPANVLIRADGRPCIVDFGVSALLQRGSASPTGRFCSPGYSAPECYQRAAPDTSQDVYSLGAVLGDLLVDGGVSAAFGTETARRVPTEPLDLPPLRTRDGGRLPADLAAVLRRATALRPEQRYRSVGAMNADLHAWLDHRPVAALNGGWAYRSTKWVRRHAVGAAFAVLLCTSLIGGAAIALYQAGVARNEAARALAVRDFAVGLFTAADPVAEYGADPAASELLTRGAARVEVELAGQSALLSEMLHLIGAIQLQRGLVADASATLDRALAIVDGSKVRPAVRAEALSDRGMAAYEQGDLERAVAFLGEALELADTAAIDRAARAQIATRLADMHVVRMEPEPALALIEPVLAELDLENAAQPAAPGTESALAYALRVKGTALELAGELDDAVRFLERALAIQRAADPDHVSVAKILNDLGIAHWQRLDLNRAAEVLVESLAHKRRIYGEVHPQTLASLGNLAAVQAERGDFEAAEGAYLESLDALAALHGDQAHPDTAYTYGMLAWTRYRRGAVEPALANARAALDMTEALADANPMLGWIRAMTGLVALEAGAPDGPELLGPWSEDCVDLDAVSPLSARICLARAWLASAENHCDAGLPPRASPETLAALPIRWRAVHDALVSRCSDGDDPPPADLPVWAKRSRR